MGIPSLIIDLAVMMLTAGVITVIFKKINQPLILGYILAGFLLSPYFPWFANILDTESVETWSQIGIIFMMFHLGLEFNLHKLAKIGSTAIIASMVETVGLIILGFFAGQLLGFTTMDSIVLGAMIVMSSTTIIIKVFDELKLKDKYTEFVFGILVLEDIVGIFMMVIMSTIAVSKNVSGTEVISKLLLMVLYLIVWLVLGIYILPTLMEKAIKFMNDEMLIVVSIGICLGMVLLADFLGFSTALGAFLAGSLLAGTIHVERIQNITKGIKDLFGAVFFISVGMMANPSMIVKYWFDIIVIIIVTIVGKITFGMLGLLLSGQTLRNSVSAGFSLAQIGEFSFIMASLGYSLGLIDEFIYPVIVAVSVITTFTTPFLIKLSGRFCDFLEKVLPEKLLNKLNKYTTEEKDAIDKEPDWIMYMKKYFLNIILYGGIMLVAAIVLSTKVPTLLSAYVSLKVAKIICAVVIYIIMVVFSVPLLNLHDDIYTSLWLKGGVYRFPLSVLNIGKIGIISAIAMIPIKNMLGVRALWLVLVVAALIILFSRSSFVTTWYLRLETRFLKNFNERIIKKEEEEGNKQEWLDETLHIISFKVPSGADFIGKDLKSLDWGNKYNVNVVKIRHNEKRILLPNREEKLYEGDKVFAIGEKQALENFYKVIKVEKTKPIRTLKKFMDSGYSEPDNALVCIAIKVNQDDSFKGKTLKQGNFKNDYNSLVVGLQKNGLPIIMPDPNIMISKGDILWVMGSNKDVGKLLITHMDE